MPGVGTVGTRHGLRVLVSDGPRLVEDSALVQRLLVP